MTILFLAKATDGSAVSRNEANDRLVKFRLDNIYVPIGNIKEVVSKLVRKKIDKTHKISI